MPATTNRPPETAASCFPCEGCGGQMAFDPDTQGLKCGQCGRTQAIPEEYLEAPEYLYDANTDAYEAPDWAAMGEKKIRCENCGAETAVSAAAMTSRCPFCGSGYVVDEDGVVDGVLPETLMPFQFSRAKAEERFRAWVKKRFWAPRAFKKARHDTRALQGVYLPFWTFDAQLDTAYQGWGGRDRTVTYTTTDSEGNTTTHTKIVTDWYPIAGREQLAFDDEALCATRHVDQQQVQQLGAYSTKVLRRYSPAFLAGFTAQRYDVGVGEGWSEAAGRMKVKMAEHIRDREGYDRYRDMDYEHWFSNVKFKHILLPVWLSSYTYKNKVYKWMMNGETGKAVGKAPVSPWKVLALIAGIVAVVAGFYLLAQGMGWIG